MSVYKFKVGDIVEVTPAYRGGNVYLPDGDEGICTIVGTVIGGPDYYLVHGIDREAEKRDWQLICHESRLKAYAG